MLTTVEDTKVYFRVSDVYRDMRVVAKVGDEVLYDKKKQKLAPGEMESVTLTADKLALIGEGVIEFSLEK